MSPLIPVMKKLPKGWAPDLGRRPKASAITRGYLEFFEPDTFVSTTQEQFEQSGLKRERSWFDPGRHRLLSDLVAVEPGSDPYFTVGLGMYEAYWHLFAKEFQFRKRVDPRILMFEGGDRISKAFFEACYGIFPEDARLAHLSQSYRDALGAETVAPSIEIWQTIERHEAGYPLYYTTRGLEQRFHNHLDDTIFIFDPLNAADVIDFWNIRQFRANVLPVNVHWLEQSRDFIMEHIRGNYRPLPSNHNGVMIGTSILVGRSLSDEDINESLRLTDEDLPDRPVRAQKSYPSIWRPQLDEHLGSDLVAPPLIAKAQEVQVVPQDDGQTIPVPRLNPEFIEYSRSNFGWVNVISPRFYGSNTRFAEALPSAAYIDSNAYPPRAHHEQHVTREGYLVFEHFVKDGASFNVPTMQEAVIAWLKAHDIEAVPSDAGRVADQLITSAGSLWMTALFIHEEAIRLFDNMARSRAVRIDGTSEEFPGRTATISQVDAMLSKVRRKFENSEFAVDSFIKTGVLQLGIAVRCAHCTKENWYSLDDVASEINCERCLKRFPFPQAEFPKRDMWKYRVVGPFATPHFAQGGYSVAHTLRTIERVVSSLSQFTYTTALELKHKGGLCETDFFAWSAPHASDRSSSDPIHLVGECKSFGADLFKSQDIARLKTLGELFPGAYLVASMLKKEPSPAEKKRLKALAEWGWKRGRTIGRANRLIVLTGVELLSTEHSLIKSWELAGGACAAAATKHRHILNFSTLAQATQEAHLGFAEGEILKLRYPKKR